MNAYYETLKFCELWFVIGSVTLAVIVTSSTLSVLVISALIMIIIISCTCYHRYMCL